jgi:hypothetical protein
MEKQPRIRGKHGPEKIIQDAVINYFRAREWLVKSTHGGPYQSGFPDLFMCHNRYGSRWCECKNPEKYAFTPAQMEWFPKFAAHGCGIWIVTAATQEQYERVVKGPPNWHMYLGIWKSL